MNNITEHTSHIPWTLLGNFQKKIAITLLLLAVGTINYYIFVLPFWPLVKVAISSSVTGYIGFLVIRANEKLSQK